MEEARRRGGDELRPRKVEVAGLEALACLLLLVCSDLERRHLQDKERWRKEMAAKIKETKTAMAQLAGEKGSGDWGLG